MARERRRREAGEKGERVTVSLPIVLGLHLPHKSTACALLRRVTELLARTTELCRSVIPAEPVESFRAKCLRRRAVKHTLLLPPVCFCCSRYPFVCSSYAFPFTYFALIRLLLFVLSLSRSVCVLSAVKQPLKRNQLVTLFCFGLYRLITCDTSFYLLHNLTYTRECS